MALLEFSDLAYGYSDERVIVAADGALQAGNVVGLVGANGGGKTTLLRLLLGELAPEEGRVQRAREARVAYVSQTAGGEDDERLFAFVKQGRSALVELRAQLDQLAADLEHRPGDRELLGQLGRAEERFTALNGHRWDHDVERLLLGLSFRRADFDKPLGLLSGGQRQKACLARALLSDSNCLIFDEPTNHLDLAAQAFFVDFVRELPGEHAVLLVSHDRWLLDALATHIWELDGGELFRYPGNYSKYAPLRDQRRSQARLAFTRQQEQIARTEEYIRRNIAGQNTRQARGRRKLLGRMERLEKPADDPQLSFILQPALKSGEQLLIVEGLSFAYGSAEEDVPETSAAVEAPNAGSSRGAGKQDALPTYIPAGPSGLNLNPPLTVARSALSGNLVIGDFGLQLYRGERLGIVGPNGCGKTTLLRLLAKSLAPQRGMVAWGTNAELGVFSQDSSDLEPQRDVLGELRSVEPKISDSDARDYLARFGFSGDDVFAQVSTLSGGERSRLTLAKIFRRRPNVLVLDEPTNHLDIYAREALEQFLLNYSGSLLMVTHDRALLERVCNRLVVFPYGAEETPELIAFRGGYSDFLTWRERGGGRTPAAEGKPRDDDEPESLPDPSRPESLSIYDVELLAKRARTSVAGYIAKQQQREQAKADGVEDEIAALEQRIADLRRQQRDADSNQEYDRLTELQAEIEGTQEEIESLFTTLELLHASTASWHRLASQV